ncbi:hypothetical protein SDC9_39038 [bioreactor metagenome]|uniref:Uncharacterized protein n=1 Tax=bioreactor metagenome TaxID=1076179 RepID=A0A644VNB5_9ZZZZ
MKFTPRDISSDWKPGAFPLPIAANIPGGEFGAAKEGGSAPPCFCFSAEEHERARRPGDAGAGADIEHRAAEDIAHRDPHRRRDAVELDVVIGHVAVIDDLVDCRRCLAVMCLLALVKDGQSLRPEAHHRLAARGPGRGLFLGHLEAAKAADVKLHVARRLAEDLRRQEVHYPDEIGHTARVRPAVEGFGIGELGDLALEHHRDPVRHHEGLFLVVGDQNEGDAHLALQLDQLDLHLLADLLVERRERLIEEQHLRLQDQRAGKRHALPLPARKRMCRARAIALEPDHLERLFHRLRLLGLRARIAAQAETDVLAHGEMREDRVGLEHHVGRALVRRDIGHVLAVDQHRARGDVLEARDGAQKRGLAAARGAKEREELALADRRSDPAQRVVITVVFVHLVELDHLRAAVERCAGRGVELAHRKPPVSLAPVFARPRRRKYSAVARSTIEATTRQVPSAMIIGICFGKRSCEKM